jgi:hypothetical protein
MNADFAANPAQEKADHPGSPNNLIAQKARSWRGIWWAQFTLRSRHE